MNCSTFEDVEANLSLDKYLSGLLHWPGKSASIIEFIESLSFACKSFYVSLNAICLTIIYMR